MTCPATGPDALYLIVSLYKSTPSAVVQGEGGRFEGLSSVGVLANNKIEGGDMRSGRKLNHHREGSMEVYNYKSIGPYGGG